MKKTVKTKKIIKKTVKTAKTARSPKTPRAPGKRKKAGFSDAVRAFMLVGVIVAFSALISCAVIMVHSNANKEGEVTLKEEAVQTVPEPAPIVVTVEPQPTVPQPKPEIVSPPAENRSSASQRPSSNRPVVERPTTTPSIEGSTTVTTVSAVIPPKPIVENKGTLVFVIDDAGNSLKDLEPFLQVPGPLTIAVLPGLPNSAESARRIRAAGKEVILHQPMEAIGGQDPGPGAIYSGMNASEIRAILARNIAEVGPVVGVNNHQGSKITMDREIMQVILDFCSDNNLYFLDSRTTAESVVSAVAKQMSIKTAERNIFIDNEQNKDSMLRYISGGLVRAQRNGSAVLIGHTWSPDLAPLLKEHFPLFVEQGFTIKNASDIIK